MVDLKKILSKQNEVFPSCFPALFFPDYSGFGLANLPDSICRWLGVPAIGSGPLNAGYSFSISKYDQIIFVLVDGLGWNRFERWIQEEPENFPVWKELFGAGQISPLTSIAPSTTCAALTTLNSGVPPAAHGNLAYELWLKEFGVVANMITHAPMAGGEPGSLQKYGFHPADFLPVTTLDAHLISHGVAVSALHPAGISRSSLTCMLFPQAELHGYHSMGDLWFRLQQFCLSPRQLPAYHFIYWSEIDELSHLYSPDDVRVKLAFRDFSLYLRDLVESRKPKSAHKTLLVITADHGLQSTPVNENYDLSRHPGLVDCLSILPTGENRLAFLHIKPGKEEQVTQYLETTWPGKFDVFSSERIAGQRTFWKGKCLFQNT